MAPSSLGSGAQSKQLALPKDAKFPYPQIGGAEALGASFPDALNPLDAPTGAQDNGKLHSSGHGRAHQLGD